MHAILALLIALAPVPHGHHYGWQNPHNPHHVTVTNPWRGGTPSCHWVVGGAIGDVPHCV